MKVDGIIIRIAPYRDSGAMINILTADAVLPFYGRDIYKMDAKNSVLSSPLMCGEFTFDDNDKNIYTFKEVAISLDTRKYINDLVHLAALNFLNEVTIQLFDSVDAPKAYPYLLKTLTLLNNKDKIPELLLAYLAVALRITGNALNVDACVLTGKKERIVGVSYLDGGFVSKEAYDPNRHKLYSPTKCQILRQIFKVSPDNLALLNFPKKETFEVLNDLFIYTYDQTGIRFKSEQLINKMI